MYRIQVFLFFANNSRSKQNKKNPEQLFVYIGKQETYVKFQQKIFKGILMQIWKFHYMLGFM